MSLRRRCPATPAHPTETPRAPLTVDVNPALLHLTFPVTGLLICWFITAWVLSRLTQGILRLFDFALDEGHLFSRWYSFIQLYEESHPKVFKVLGGCIVCSGFWATVVLFSAYRFVFPLPLPLPVFLLHQALVVTALVRRARREQRRQVRHNRDEHESAVQYPTFSYTSPSGAGPVSFTANTTSGPISVMGNSTGPAIIHG